MSNPTGRGGFRKGESGNPGGRSKKGTTLTDLIAEKLDKKKFIEKLCALSYKGDITAIKEVLNRIDGKVRETILIEGNLAAIIARMPPEAAKEYLEKYFSSDNSND